MHTTFVFLASLAMAIANLVPQGGEPKCSVGTPLCCNGIMTAVNIIADSCIRCNSCGFSHVLATSRNNRPCIQNRHCYLDLQLILYNGQINPANASAKTLIRRIAVMPTW